MLRWKGPTNLHIIHRSELSVLSERTLPFVFPNSRLFFVKKLNCLMSMWVVNQKVRKKYDIRKSEPSSGQRQLSVLFRAASYEPCNNDSRLSAHVLRMHADRAKLPCRWLTTAHLLFGLGSGAISAKNLTTDMQVHEEWQTAWCSTSVNSISKPIVKLDAFSGCVMQNNQPSMAGQRAINSLFFLVKVSGKTETNSR